MTDDPKPRQDAQFTQEDDRLVNELESIYRRVDSPDSPEVASDIAENPDPYYKILQIHPNVSLPDIQLAYGRMTSAWDPGRYPHVPSWKEKSTEKLKEIKNAYEKLLFMHAARETADPEERAPVRANINVFSGSTFKLRPWLLAPGALIAIILLLVLLWPTLYHYEAVRLEGKVYPLRINRLTTHTQYFDGLQWLEPPFRAEIPHNVPPKIASPSLPAQITGAGIRNEPKPSLPPLAKQEIKPPDRISVETKTRGPYSIQVSAYPARNKAEALAKAIEAKKFAIRVEAVSIQGKGQWYRVLLGQFENPDAALQYLKDHQIKETYPESFIQKSVTHSK